MAQYEMKVMGQKAVKPIHTEHDKTAAIDWAEAYTAEHGLVVEVYEVKHVHLTSKVKENDFAFF